MHPETSFSKRIKRHVIGRTRDYFVVTPPGFENLCLQELSMLPLGIRSATVTTGGVEFKGRLDDCYLANLNLRTANRILLRIHTFKASNFRQLEKKLVEIPWELYLFKNSTVEFHVTARHCRLYHTEAIEKRISESMAKGLSVKTTDGDDAPALESAQQIFVRGLDDQFTVSIDSSGDNLYKRGLKKHTGRAPLRENLAAASLLLAGYRGDEPLVDPMCGTGTYSLEAALMAKRIPPGWFREFAFMKWPSFRSTRFAHLKRQFEEHFQRLEKPLIIASDKDPAACRRLEKSTRKFDLNDAISIINQDFFELAPGEFADQPGVVAINPPYGRRIGTRQNSRILFQAICQKLGDEYKGWKLVLIAPSKKLAESVPFKINTFPFRHGGLKPVLMVGIID